MSVRLNSHKKLLFLLVLSMVGGCATEYPVNETDHFPQQDQVSTNLPSYHGQAPYSNQYNEAKYVAMLPKTVDTGNEKLILVDPKSYAWGAYDEQGNLVRGGIASAGANYCPDEGRSCKTTTGTFRIYSLGAEDCRSRTYPLGKGGSLMPYCMFFHKGESLHGSPDQMFTENNISHGCVHMRIPDVEWLRFNFAKVGTKVTVLPY